MRKVSPLNENKPISPALAYLNINVNDNVNKDVYNDVANNVNIDENINIYENVYKQKKPKFEDLYTRKTYYIDNLLLPEINKICGNEKGIKTQFINDAIREHLKRLECL